MSRIGKKPVPLPAGVTANISGQTIEVKGPKGALSFKATDDVTLVQEDGAIAVRPRGDSKRARQQWGMSRSMVENLVTGVTQGFKKELDITGVGYRANMQGNTLKLALGYSHDVSYEQPAGIKGWVESTRFTADAGSVSLVANGRGRLRHTLHQSLRTARDGGNVPRRRFFRG